MEEEEILAAMEEAKRIAVEVIFLLLTNTMDMDPRDSDYG